MHKFFTTLSAMLFLSTAAVAQSPSVSGTLVDEAGEPLIGANVLLRDEQDSVMMGGTATDTAGNFRVEVTTPGSYLLKASYLGYVDFKKVINIGNGAQELGKIILRRDEKVLEEVTVAVKAAAAVVKGDTVEYNAGAYKVNPDAVVQDVVTKMPGVTVDGGQVKVQGEDVRKVLIDGKEFFGDDANIALKNLNTQAGNLESRQTAQQAMADAAQASAEQAGLRLNSALTASGIASYQKIFSL